MKIDFLNKDELANGKFFERWGKFTSVCYTKGVPDLSNDHEWKKIGLACLSTGHYSGCRHIMFEFLVTGVSRALTHQLVRKQIGTIINQQSLRYVDPFDQDGVGFSLPSEAFNDAELMKIFSEHINDTEKKYKLIQKKVEDLGGSKERARECARLILPLCVNSSLTIAFSLEALMDFCNKRCCLRAEEPIRELAIAMKNVVIESIPELSIYLGSPCEIGKKCFEKKCARKIEKIKKSTDK